MSFFEKIGLGELDKNNAVEKMQNLGRAAKESIANTVNTEYESFKSMQYMNNPDELFNMGEAYLYGDGVERNIQLARQNWERAAQIGHPTAKCWLYWLNDITGCKQTISLSIDEMIQLATNLVDSGHIEDGIHYLEILSDNGNMFAKNRLGLLLSKSEFIPPDYDRAMRLFREVANSTDSDSKFGCVNIAQMYREGKGVKRDYELSRDYFEEAARRGHNHCQSAIQIMNERIQSNGCMILNFSNLSDEDMVNLSEQLIERDAREELVLLGLELQRRGNVSANRVLAYYYLAGVGGERDVLMAQVCLNKAESQRDARAYMMAGAMNEYGNGIPVNYAGAIQNYQEAIQLGDELAVMHLRALQLNLFLGRLDEKNCNSKQVDFEGAPTYGILISSETAESMKNGTGDWDLRIVWANMEAAVEGYVRAQTELGVAYFLGDAGVEKNDREAFCWLKKAAEGGSAEAYYFMGLMYAAGTGMPVNFEKARECYQKAKEFGIEDMEFENGILGGIEKDGVFKIVISQVLEKLDKVEEFLDNYDRYALMSAEEAFERGKQFIDNEILTVQYMQIAAQKGQLDAEGFIGELYLEGVYVCQSYEKARELLERAAAKGDDNALYLMGTLYHYGKGVDKDMNRAINFYKSAYSLGNTEAKEALECLGILAPTHMV